MEITYPNKLDVFKASKKTIANLIFIDALFGTIKIPLLYDTGATMSY